MNLNYNAMFNLTAALDKDWLLNPIDVFPSLPSGAFKTWVYQAGSIATPERRVQKKPVGAERPPLLPDFTFEEGDRRNLGVTVAGRLFCTRSGPV
ncbi:hypothetical protein [Paenibacillus sp. JNUCC31]|uniref:hypothetical protein n=1 Tax=Paenibacillus sp. JNUCC-31 TaxID=2777983 RepID=UPI001E391D08|nr:hypothetical protein [Paenibacillus sp. JNUCC-31]